MRIKFTLLACCFLLMISGCNKSTGPSGNPVIEYEITADAPFANNILGSPITGLFVSYTNETGQFQQEQLSPSGTKWKKKVIVTTPQRPIAVGCMAEGIVTGSGKVEVNVYVDGVLRGSNSVNAIESAGFWQFGPLMISGILIQ